MPANRKTAPRATRFPRPVVCLLIGLALAAACSRQSPPLTPADLTPAERTLINRFLVLERARAVALADTAAGRVVLDSLADAWGDTSLAAARRALPADPRRLAAFYDLLARLVTAEQESLKAVLPGRRLSAPLPVPVPPSRPGG